MILSLSEQAHLFVVSIFLGLKIFFVYDFFRALRKVKSFENIQVHIQDFIFIIVVTVYAFYLYLYESNGAIRFYYFIGIGLGSLVYLLTISNIVVLVLSKTILTFEKALIRCLRICFYPIKIFTKIFRPYIKIYKGKLIRKAKKSKRYMGKPKKFVKVRLKSFKRMIKIILEKV